MAAASRARGRVLAFAFFLTIVTYLDRICISAAAPFIRSDLRLSALEMSYVFSAFTLAYAVFEVPSGWLGDRIGPRRVLTRIVLWWSLFTMLTGVAQGLRSLISIRFLFGAGEAGAFPNIACSFSRWFPARERGRATGVMMLGSRVGGMLSAPVAVFLIGRWGWRASFVMFGAVGVVWAVAWYVWYRDWPAEHPAVNREEVVWIQGDGGRRLSQEEPPWHELLGSSNLYAICAMYFGYGYGLYFYFTWLPTYLIQVLGFSLVTGALFAALPFLLAGLADVVGGWLTDRLSRSYGLKLGRCGVGFGAFVMSALFILASTSPGSAVSKAVLLALALGSADLALSACWAAPVDVAPRHAGVITGFMNTAGNLGGFVAPLVVGYFVDEWQSWTYPFYVTALIYVGGAVAWLAIDPTRQLVADTYST